MGRAARWMVAAVMTLGVFAVSVWVSGAFILPLWIKSGSDRWVIATGVGLAIAALAALWGVSFARHEQQGNAGPTDSPRPAEVTMTGTASEHGRVNQAGRDQIVGVRRERQKDADPDTSRPASVHMEAEASGSGQVNQAGRDQTLDER
jgi:hypothetical protein